MIAFLLTSLLSSSIIDSKTYLVGRDTWTLGVSDAKGRDSRFAFIAKNGRTVLERGGDWMYFKVARGWYPAPWPVFVVSISGGISDSLTTEFYALRRGELQLVLTITGLKGGPVFRDIDGDGEQEWIFDDFEHHESFQTPQHYLVYKASQNGVSLWKTLPNRLRQTVPMPWYRLF